MAGENFTLTRSNLVTVCSDDTNILYPLTITDQVKLTSELSAEEITLTQWIKNLVIPSPTGIDIDPEYNTGLLLATINDVLIKVPTAGYANYGLIKINSDYFAFDGDSDSLVTNFQWVPNSSYGDSVIGIGSIRGDNNKLISNVTMPTPSLDYSIGTDNAYLQLDLDLGNTNLQQLQISKEDIQAIALDGFTGIGSYTLSVDSTGTELTLSDGTDPHTTTATIASYTAGTGINITGTGVQKTVSLQYGAGDGIIFDTENNQIKLAQAAYDNSSTPTVDTFGGIRLGYDNTSSPNNKPLKVDTNGRAYIENTEGAGTLTIKLGDNTTLGTFAANQTGDTTVNIPLNLTYEVVTTLPTTNISTNCIYLILDTVGHQASENIYNEYMYINNDWELLGTTEVTFTQQQADWTEDDTSAASFINNKPTLASVATSGSYNDLINKPNFATVATSGSYTDLSNKPDINNSLISLFGGTDDDDPAPLSIGTFNLNQSSGEDIYIPRMGGANGTNAGTMGLVPAPSATDNTKFLCGNGTWATPTAPVQSDWNQSDDTALDYIKNKPTIPAAQIQSDWNQTDNTSKDYIKNKPTIPAAQVNADWNASSGAAQILNKPTIPAAANNAKITIATNNTASSSDSFGDFRVDDSTDKTINIPRMKGATTSANGLAGLVPAPTSSDRDSFLRGDGNWENIRPSVAGLITNGLSSHSFRVSNNDPTSASSTSGVRHFIPGTWIPLMQARSTNHGKCSVIFEIIMKEDSKTAFGKYYLDTMLSLQIHDVLCLSFYTSDTASFDYNDVKIATDTIITVPNQFEAVTKYSSMEIVYDSTAPADKAEQIGTRIKITFAVNSGKTIDDLIALLNNYNNWDGTLRPIDGATGSTIVNAIPYGSTNVNIEWVIIVYKKMKNISDSMFNVNVLAENITTYSEISYFYTNNSSIPDTNESRKLKAVYNPTTVGSQTIYWIPDKRVGTFDSATKKITSYLTLDDTEQYALSSYDVTNSTFYPQTKIGTTTPSSIPSMVGQQYIDTNNRKVYVAVGTSSSSDWVALN